MKSTNVSTQTMHIREETNKQIRNLGNKYYFVKTKLEQLNLKRDDLFFIGRELEIEFKGIKNVTHLQNQKKRMKDALYCWYCENFYAEILTQNPLIIGRLIKTSLNQSNTKTKQNSLNKVKIFNIGQINSTNNKNFNTENNGETQNNKCANNQKDIGKNSLKSDLPLDIFGIKNSVSESSILNNAKINEEIDTYELSNINIARNNFNFDEYLNKL